MDKWVTNVRGKAIIDGTGDWVQAEHPAQVIKALLAFSELYLDDGRGSPGPLIGRKDPFY